MVIDFKKMVHKILQILSAYYVWSTALGSGIKWNGKQNSLYACGVYVLRRKQTSLNTHIYSTHVCVCGIMQWLSRTRNGGQSVAGLFCVWSWGRASLTRWFLNKDLKDALCGGRALPVEGTASVNACRRVHWDVGLPYRQWKHSFADGLGNRKKRMPFIATLKNREGASGIRRKKRNDISKWRSWVGTEYGSLEFPKLSGCHWWCD